MSGFNYNTLTEVIQNCLIYDEPKKPLKEISSEIGKPYFTFTRELNPDDDGAKLGADLILPIMNATGDIRPLEWLAKKMGYSLSKIDVVPDKDTWEAEHVQDMSAIGKMSQLMEKDAHPFEVFKQAEKVKKEIDETVQQYFNTYQTKNLV